jgi:hypothetical protein
MTPGTRRPNLGDRSSAAPAAPDDRFRSHAATADAIALATTRASASGREFRRGAEGAAGRWSRTAPLRLKEQCRERPARWLLGHRRSTHARGELSLLVPCDSELEGRWRHRSSISKRKRPSASPAADRRLLRDEMQQTAGRAHYRLPRGERACHVGLRVPESLPPSEQRNGHRPAVQGYGVAPHDVASRPQRLEHHQLIPELAPAGSGEGSRRAD